MNITEFVLKVGISDALDIFGEGVWEKVNLTFDQWEEQFVKWGKDRRLQKQIFAKMVQTASTVEHWTKHIWRLEPKDESLRLLGLQKIKEEYGAVDSLEQLAVWGMTFIKDVDLIYLQRAAELAKTTEDWQQVTAWARHVTGKLEAHAFQNLMRCAANEKTFHGWELAYHETLPENPERKEILSSLIELAQTYEEWFKVWYWSRHDYKDLEKRALPQALAKASTFDNVFAIFLNSEEGGNAKLLSTAKLWRSAENFGFGEWLAVYKVSGGEIKEAFLNKMLEKATTLDDWLKVWRSTPDGSGAQGVACCRVRSFVDLK